MSTECLIRDKNAQQAVLVLLDGNVTSVVPKLKEKYWQHGWESIRSFVLAGKANHTVYESVSAAEFETDADRVDGLFPLYLKLARKMRGLQPRGSSRVRC